jgi:hypothetical protein
MYNLPELHRQMLDVLGIKDTDEIVPLQDDIKPVDPVSAVQNILSGKPVKAFPYQDHDAHIQTVMSAQQNPEILELLQQSPNAGAIQAAGMGYVTDHLQLKFRKQIEDELGIELPPMGEPLPAELEKRLSVLVAEASDILTNKAQRQQQAEQIQEQLQDPIIQQKQEELRIKAKKHDDDMQIAKAKLTVDVAKAAEKEMTERMRIKSQEGMAGANLGQKIASDLLDAQQAESKQAREDYMKGVDLGVKIAEDSIKDGK